MTTYNAPPAPPGHLSEEAAGHWSRLVGEFELGPEGLLLLEGALESFDRMRAAQAEIAAKGLLLQDRFGQWKANPACAIEDAAKRQVTAQVKALGLDIEPLQATGRPPLNGAC